MLAINVKPLEFGETVTAHGADIVADTGEVLFTAGPAGESPAFLVMLPPEQAIVVGKALIKAGRKGSWAKFLEDTKPQD